MVPASNSAANTPRSVFNTACLPSTPHSALILSRGFLLAANTLHFGYRHDAPQHARVRRHISDQQHRTHASCGKQNILPVDVLDGKVADRLSTGETQPYLCGPAVTAALRVLTSHPAGDGSVDWLFRQYAGAVESGGGECLLPHVVAAGAGAVP